MVLPCAFEGEYASRTVESASWPRVIERPHAIACLVKQGSEALRMEEKDGHVPNMRGQQMMDDDG